MDYDDEPKEETQETSGDANEARLAMEEAARKKKEKVENEIAEYEEMRREQREKEADDLDQLRQKREQRKQERIEDDRRMLEIRKEEDKRRKAEEEERKRKKQEDERKRIEAKKAKLKEMEERKKMSKTPNFVITKKGATNLEEASKDMAKSKEQLEEEKRAILAQRIQPLSVDGLDLAALAEKATELHNKIKNLANDKYELEERFKSQQYDMIELAERARQMNKGKKRAVQVDDSFDPMAEKYSSAPPKVQMYSKYERHTDLRSYGNRVDYFETKAKKIEAELAVGKKDDEDNLLETTGEEVAETPEGEAEAAPAAEEE
ncbi:troponin T, skeletal muscle-like isoform X2 [Pecten maximus]|uniref:troponin T, skeletal muscle-like isoform X2 n=1 Tax=Pecten maximus TaxID=6579 RepID=UPI001458AFB0|nr:troponin T, skeletal muscle-like isoform X2 [Pecten maximus]XP_033752996.1 troponin T, skeletal muscle-like isoform X2 [Pecten maximus]XP_033752997.1 troponin T, skeletal muscle-like isoform X2 [Pecten maximus]